jgi:hypothetical protein
MAPDLDVLMHPLFGVARESIYGHRGFSHSLLMAIVVGALAAASQCTAQAAPYGAVNIIDVEQRSINQLIVWGTAVTGETRQSFECAFGTKITSFRIRPIGPARSAVRR